MNGMLDVQESLSADHLQDSDAIAGSTMDHIMTFSDKVSRNDGEVAGRAQQKFKSRHFPEPFWGHDV